jgi:hypothetical protein
MQDILIRAVPKKSKKKINSATIPLLLIMLFIILPLLQITDGWISKKDLPLKESLLEGMANTPPPFPVLSVK